MEVHEYTTKYITEERAVNMEKVVLNSAYTFAFVSVLLLIGMALPAVLPSESLIVKACSTISLEAAAVISVYAACKIMYTITHPKAIEELQAVAYDDHIEFIIKNIYGGQKNIKYKV